MHARVRKVAFSEGDSYRERSGFSDDHQEEADDIATAYVSREGKSSAIGLQTIQQLRSDTTAIRRDASSTKLG